MFKRKNMLVAIAVSLLLAACGGSDDAPASTAAGGTGTGTGTGTGVSGTNTAAAADALRGSLVNVADQVRFSGIDITTDQFATIAEGAGPFARGTNAPLTNFGFRVQPQNMADTAAQTKTASFAIDLTERAGSAGIAAGETAEVLQVLVDKVSVTAAADGTFSVADVPDAKAYIYFKPATGAAVNVDVPATGLVSLVPADGDSTSSFLVLDVETAITRAVTGASGDAAATLGKIKDAVGLFDMKSVVSNVGMTKANGTTALTASPIGVTGTPQITAAGGGASGAIQLQ